MEQTYDIFISYSRKDTDIANRLCKIFDKYNITYFIDRQGISGGMEFPAVIAKAIKNSVIFLFLASKNSYESKFTQSEVIFAFNKKEKRYILPYIIDDSNLPEELEFTFSAINWCRIDDHPIETTFVDDVLKMLGRKRIEPKKLDEQKEWEKVDKSDFDDILRFIKSFRKGKYLTEADNCLWKLVTANPTQEMFNRYRKEMPIGIHAQQATKELNLYNEWKRIEGSSNIFAVKKFIDKHASSYLIEEALNVYQKLKTSELTKIKMSSSSNTDWLERLRAARILSSQEFDELTMKEAKIQNAQNDLKENRDIYNCDRDCLPDLYTETPQSPESPDGNTDIYFLGCPSSGKTCLLMAIAGANGDGYYLDFFKAGGKCASMLSEYASIGLVPGATPSSFTTLIQGAITPKTKKNALYRVSFIDISGEDYVYITQNAKLEHERSKLAHLMNNQNRKLLFIFIDPTVVKPTDQDLVHNKFLSLLMLPDNAKLAKTIDAIHILVTKSDTLGDTPETRGQKAKELIEGSYKALLLFIEFLCKNNKIINVPQILTCNVGQFNEGSHFKYDPVDILNLIDKIRDNISKAEAIGIKKLWKTT